MNDQPTPLYPAASPGKPPLRVGIMLDGWETSQWVAEVLESVRDSGVASLTTVVLNREPPPVQRTWSQRIIRLLTGQSQDLGVLLWLVYFHLDQRLRSAFNMPFKNIDVRPLVPDAKVIAVMPSRKGYVHRFASEDIAEIKNEKLDVILRFGFNIIRGDILSTAKYGVWSYHHGDNDYYRGGPPAFWEMYDRNELTGSILQVLTEELDAGKVIYRTWGTTQSFESLQVNRYWQYRKAIPFVARCLRRVYEHGEAGIPPIPENSAATPYLYRTPRNGHMLRFLFRRIVRLPLARLRSRSGMTSHWFMGLARGVEPDQPLAGRVTELPSPAGRFWADPMLARGGDGQLFLFFEDYDYRTSLGRISVADIVDQSRLGSVRTALEADYHLSYPFLFEWEGDHYMIPETASVKAVKLYRATDFPTGWTHVTDLLTGIKAVDTTLYQHEGHWYLFTGVSESGGSTWDELFLFVSPSPMGPWSPHPMNPIVSDVRRARPAGALFRRNNTLYRPSQNSEGCYGRSVVISEVTELTPERYAERIAYQIAPDWMKGLEGCHTLTMADDLMVLDGKRPKWRP